MAKNNMEVAQAYYKAMEDKDLEGVARCFREDVQFISPLMQIAGSTPILQGVQKLFSVTQTFTIRYTFEEKDQIMVVYDLVCSEPIGTIRVAALLTFKEGLIGKIELFFDPRPFG